MFAQHLFKLVNRLIEMTEEELNLVKQMKLKEAGLITTEKEPLVTLYQNCIDKIQNHEKTRSDLRSWEKFDVLKKRVGLLGEITVEHERCIKRIEGAQLRFIELIQEKAMNIIQPVKNYNRRGTIVNHQKYYEQQGRESSLSTLDQAL